MKYLYFASVTILLVAISYAAVSASTVDRPSGIDERDWIAVTDRLGLVLISNGSPVEVSNEYSGPQHRPDRKLLMVRPATGYFMVRSPGGWTRLQLVEATQPVASLQ